MRHDIGESLSSLREVLELAREFRCRRVKWGEVEVELMPDEVAPVQLQLPAPAEVIRSPEQAGNRRSDPGAYRHPSLWAGGKPPSFPTE